MAKNARARRRERDFKQRPRNNRDRVVWRTARESNNLQRQDEPWSQHGENLLLCRPTWFFVKDYQRRLQRPEPPFLQQHNTDQDSMSMANLLILNQTFVNRMHRMLALQQGTCDSTSYYPSLFANSASPTAEITPSQRPFISDLECQELIHIACSPLQLRTLQDIHDKKFQQRPVQPNPVAEQFSLSQPAPRKIWKSEFLMVIHRPYGGVLQKMTKLDTGAAPNVVPQCIVEDLGMRMETYRGPMLAPVGPYVQPKGVVNFEWHVSGRLKTHRTTFVVLDDHLCRGFDILLGEEEIERIGFYIVDSTLWLLPHAP